MFSHDQRRAHGEDRKCESWQSQERSRHTRTSETIQQNVSPRIVSSRRQNPTSENLKGHLKYF